MGVVARWTGNIADRYGFSGCFVVKGKIIQLAPGVFAQVDDQLVFRVRGNPGDFIIGGTLF
jgi:hypothetical protein